MKTYKGSIYAYSRPDKTIWPIKFSVPVMEKSKFNTTASQKPANPSAAHACAIIRLLFPEESKMGMAFSSARNEVLLEVYSSRSKTRKIALYNTKHHTLSCGVLDENGDFVPNGRVSVEYIAILQTISLIIGDSDTEKVWHTVQQEFKRSGGQRIYQTTAVAWLLDALYYSINTHFDDFDMDNAIGVIDDTTPRDGFEDITENIIGLAGQFQFADIAAPKKRGRPKKEEGPLTLEVLKNKYAYVADALPPIDDNAKALIPKLEGELADFEVTESFLDQLALLAGGLMSGNPKFTTESHVGPPGAGKTLDGYAQAYVFQLPVYRTQGSQSTTKTDFCGGPIARDGHLDTFIDTNMVLAIRNKRAMFIIDDISYVREGETTCLLDIMEYPFTTQLADGSHISRACGTVFYLTANINCNGARPLNQALLDRAHIKTQRTNEDIGENQIIRMVMNKSQYHERKEVEIMYRCYELICNDIRNNSELTGIAKEPSIRTLISWAMQAKAFDNPVKATRYSILPSLMIPDELKEHVNRILTTIIIPRFPPKYKI